MKITAIKAQVKNKDRVSIYVDGKYNFSLNYTQLLAQKLHSGLEVTEQQLAELKKTSDIGKIHDRILNYVMIRPRSLREVQDYCRRKQYAPEDCAEIIAKFTMRGYLDDRAFARSWIESRRLTKSISKRKLQLELKQKGVSDAIIVEALDASEFDQRESLAALIEKKKRLSRFANDEQKLMQYLARQGFGYDEIKTALQSGHDL